MIFDVPKITNDLTRDNLTVEKTSVIYNLEKNRYEYFDGNNWLPLTFGNESGEPTGFPINSSGEVDRTSSSISFNDNNRTFTIQPTNGSFIFMIKGKLFKKSIAQTITIPSSNAEGIWFFYFDESGVLQRTNTFSNDLILKYCYIAYVYWDEDGDTVIHFGDERHGLNMDSHSHIWMHSTHGAAYISGLGLSGFNFNAGDLAIDIQFSVGSGYIRDEDILHTIPTIASTTGLRVLYRFGSGSYWRRGFQSGYSALSYSPGSRIAYNQYLNGAWQLTEVPNNKFVCYHIIATNDVNYPVMAIMGEIEYGSKAEARAGANTEINNLSGLPFYEFKFVGTVIYQTSNSFSNALKAKIVTTDTDADYVDWRFTALQPTTATTNVHNNLGGIDFAPYYHSDQPIKISNDVIFNSIKGTTKIIVGTQEIYSNTNGMSFNEQKDMGNLTNLNYVFSSGSDAKDTFLILNKKDTSNSIGIGFKSFTDKENFLFAGRSIDTDFIFLKNMGSVFDVNNGTQIAKISSNGELSINSIKINNDYGITSSGVANFSSLTVTGTVNINADTVLIKDSIIKINNSTLTASDRDIGIEFQYFNQPDVIKTGFFGLITNSSGVDYFTILTNTVNTSEKITGDFVNLKIQNLTTYSIQANNDSFNVDNSGNAEFNALTINTDYGITSLGVGTLEYLTINKDLTISGNLIINGETVIVNATKLEIGDPVIKLNKGTFAAIYNSSDIGVEFDFRDSIAQKKGFFGIELDTDGSIKYFKILKEATNINDNKFSGTLSDLKINSVLANSVVINTSYGINSVGKGLFNEIHIDGTDTIIDTTNLLIKDPVPTLNLTTLTNPYTASDIGFRFKYSDTNGVNYGFFGLDISATNGDINNFKILKSITNTNKKLTGTAVNLSVADITSSSITVNSSYGINSVGTGTLNALTVNSRKLRTSSLSLSSSITSIDLSSNSNLIYIYETAPTSIDLTGGLEGEVIYLKIKSSGSSYTWGTSIKWPSGITPIPSAIGKYDIYSFICFSTVYYGTFAFEYE